MLEVVTMEETCWMTVGLSWERQLGKGYARHHYPHPAQECRFSGKESSCRSAGQVDRQFPASQGGRKVVSSQTNEAQQALPIGLICIVQQADKISVRD